MGITKYFGARFSFVGLCAIRGKSLRQSQHGVLRPVSAVQGPVLNGFGDMLGFDLRRLFDVSNRARDFQDSVMSAGAESLLSHGAFEQALTVGGKLAEGANVAG